MTEPAFVRRPEPVLFREKVERDLYGRPSAAEFRELREPANLLRWYRVLVRITEETEDVLARDRLRLVALAPLPGVAPSEAYLSARRDGAPVLERRTNFLKHVKTRKSEVKELLGCQPLAMTSVGGLLASLVEVQEALSRDDVPKAEGLVFGLIGGLRKDQARVADLAAG